MAFNILIKIPAVLFLVPSQQCPSPTCQGTKQAEPQSVRPHKMHLPGGTSLGDILSYSKVVRCFVLEGILKHYRVHQLVKCCDRTDTLPILSM